jgi:hypothetical protein
MSSDEEKKKKKKDDDDDDDHDKNPTSSNAFESVKNNDTLANRKFCVFFLISVLLFLFCKIKFKSLKVRLVKYEKNLRWSLYKFLDK